MKIKSTKAYKLGMLDFQKNKKLGHNPFSKGTAEFVA